MDAVITLAGSPDADGEIASLLGWLRDEDEFRGRVWPRNPPPPAPGEMGTFADALTVMVGSGGAVTVLLGSIAVWLKNRRSDVTVELSLGDNKIRVEGKRVKSDPDSLAALIRDATAALRPE